MRIAEIFRSIQGEGRLTGTESIFVRTSGCNLRCRYCDTPYASWTPEGEELSVAEVFDRVNELRACAETLPSPFGRGAGGEGGGVAIAEDALFLGVDRPHPNPLPKGEGTGPQHVVLTGGEPMLLAELIPLGDALRAAGWHITVETSGTLYLPVACDLMSISPKLSNSTPPPERDPQWTWRHTLHRHAPEVIRRLTTQYDYQLKFVIDCPEDCREVETYLLEFPHIQRSRAMLMPEGVDGDTLAERAAWLAPYCARRGFQFCPRLQIEWFGAQRGT